MTTFILPLVYWRPELGRNDISCLKSYPEASAIVAGMENGCLWVFKADTTQNSSTFTLSPSAQLVGHKSPVVDIFFSRQDVDVGTAGEEQVIHTVAEDGEILLWNLSDGQCLQSSGTAFTAIPRSICVSPCSSYVFIGGDNTNLFVLDAQTLDVLCTMPDFNEWITQILCLCQRDNKVYFAVLTFTNLYQFIFDESSRCFSTLSTLKLDSAETAKCICTTANETMLAIISHKLTLIYRWDTNSIETYKQIKIPPTEGDWSNGKFNANRLYLWTRFSNIYVYEFQETGYVLKFRFESSFQCPSHSCILGNYLVSALHQGFEVFHVQDNEKLTSHQVFSLQDLWVSDATAHVQCQALTGQQILRGTRDGQLELSSFRKLFNTSDLSVSAHEGPVNCLTVIERTFISGGHDARICVWSSHLSLIHTFRHHATPIRQLFPIPATKMANHVLALASDHSISIFTIDTLKLVFLLPNFPNAPTKVWWKAHHVIVHYGHASCYAWDTKSGHIERVFHAASTEKLFSHCDFHIDIKGHSQRVASFQKSSLSMLTLDSCYVFMVNLKKLLTEEDTGLLECLLSALLVYEVEPALDEVASLPSQQISLGIRGTNGNLSLMAPRQQEAFVVSPSVTASRLLGLYLVARAIFMTKGHSEDSVQVIFSRFLNRLPSAIGPNFCYPSLAFFSKHWLDALPELQSGSRQLFLWTLHQMPEVKQALVRQYWCQHLPTCQHSKILSKTMCRATVIMAVMVCEYPTTFTLEATKEISTSLVLLMNEEDSTKSVYRLSSIELLGHGFVTWQPHLNTHQLVRTLVQLSIAVSNSPVAIKAKEALLLLGRTQVNLLVQTMVHDLDHGKASTDKILILKCLSFLVTQDPLILLSSLPRILESVIKSLDPTLPGTRDVLLQPTTVTLFEILKKYPSVCFHASHQRLCVGTMEGMIVIWDLKTATKLHLLEGHSRAVDAVAFSSDAKSIVSFSLQEQSIKLWQQSSGFMFFGNATLKFAKSLRHTSTTTNVLSLRLSLQDRTIEILDDVSRETYPY